MALRKTEVSSPVDKQNPAEQLVPSANNDSEANATSPTVTDSMQRTRFTPKRTVVQGSPLSARPASVPVACDGNSSSSNRHDVFSSPSLSEKDKRVSPSSASKLQERCVATTDLRESTHVTPILLYQRRISIANYNTSDGAGDACDIRKEKDLHVHHGDGKREEEKGEDGEGEVIDVQSLNERISDVLENSCGSSLSISHFLDSHSSLSRAAFHIFKGNVGAGVFLLPTYYKNTGYGLGTLVLVLLGVLMIDCALALLYSKQKISRIDVRTYPAVVEHVLGRPLMHFTRFSLIFTQFGFCVVYIQYASSMFASLFSAPQMYELFVFLSVVVVTPMTFFSHHMEALAYASMVAAVFVAFVLAGAAAEETGYLLTQGAAPGTVFFVPTMHIFLFISGHMFALEGIGVVLPVENSVSPADRPRFGRLVKYTLSSVVILYMVFGVLGYLAFGEALQTSVVHALPPSVMKTLLQVLLGLSLLFGYPIQYVPAIQLVDRSLRTDVRKEKGKALFVRVLLNALFGMLAGSIGADTINVFASFLGAFTGVHLMVTMPVLLALLTDLAVDSNSDVRERENLSFGDYFSFFFRAPHHFSTYRWYAYLLFAMYVWVGGTYYTLDSVFTY